MSSSTNTKLIKILTESSTNCCGIQIYWNNEGNEYWEVFTQKRHICPNSENKAVPTPPLKPLSTAPSHIDLLVYYEMPLGNGGKVKSNFNNCQK